MTGQGAAAAPHRHGERLPSSRRAVRRLVLARASPARRLTGAGGWSRTAASALLRQRRGGAPGAGPGATLATRGSAYQVRRVGEAADWWSRGEGRAHAGSRRRKVAALRSGSLRGLCSGTRVRTPCSFPGGCRTEKGLLLPVCGSQGSPAARAYLSSRRRAVSGASDLGPCITVTLRIPQTTDALAAGLARLWAGMGLPS